MALSSRKPITARIIHWLAVIVALALNFLGEAVFAQTANPNAVAPSQAQSQNSTTIPSAWQRFQIRQDTPSERAAFLKKREQALASHPPHDVPPLRAQAITPPASLKP